MPSHYLNQNWNIVIWTLRNNLQWKFNQNSNIFIQENALVNVICEMASILFWPQCVKKQPYVKPLIHVLNPKLTMLTQLAGVQFFWAVPNTVRNVTYSWLLYRPIPAIQWKLKKTLLKIFKGSVMIFLCCVHRVNFIIFANVLKQLCRAFYQITVWTKISAKIIESTLLRVAWKNTRSLKYFEQNTLFFMVT